MQPKPGQVGTVVEAISKGTGQYFSKLWEANLDANIPYCRKHGGILKYRDKFKYKPVVICGAGPSMRWFLKTVYKYRDRCLVFVVDKVGCLLPFADFVINVDGQREVREYVTYPNDSTLIVSSSVHPSVHKAWLGKAISFYHMTDPNLKWMNYENMEKRTGPLGRLLTRGFVTAQAIDFARFIGAEPIYLLGSEFAFTGNYVGADSQLSLKAIASNPDANKRLVFLGEKGVFTNHNLMDAGKVLQHLREVEPEFKKNVIPCGEGGLWNKTEDFEKMIKDCKPFRK